MSEFSDLYDDAAATIAAHHGESITYRREAGEEIALTAPLIDPADPAGEMETRGPQPIVIEIRKADLTDGIELHGDSIYWNERWYRVKAIESEDSASWVIRCVPSD